MADDSAKKIYTALFEIAGKMDKSLVQAGRDAKQIFKTLDEASKSTDMNVAKAVKSLNQMASVSSRLRVSAREFGSAWTTAAHKVSSALSPLHRLLGGIGRISGIGSIAGAAFGGFELSRFIAESSKVSAEREVLATQIHTLLKNRGQEGMTNDLIMQMRTYSDQESIFRYMPVANVAAQMLVSKYKPSEILPEMRKIGELSKDDATLSLVGDITSQVHQRGYVTKNDLTRMQKDAKVPIYEYLLKAMGQKDDLKNEVALFKRLRTPAKDPVPAKYFERAEQMMVEQGAPYYGHQMAQLMTFQGQYNSLLDRADDVRKGFGDSFNAFVYPVMRLLNQIKPAQIQSFFDQMLPKASQLGSDIKEAFTFLGKTGELQSAWSNLGSIFSQIGEQFFGMFGAGNGESTMKRIVDVFRALNATLKWINDNFKSIAWWAKAVMGTLIAINAIKFGAGIVSAVNTLAAAFMGLRGSATAAKVAMGEATAARAIGGGIAEAAGGGIAGAIFNPATAGLAAGVAAGVLAKTLTDKYKLPFKEESGIYHDPMALRTDDDPRYQGEKMQMQWAKDQQAQEQQRQNAAAEAWAPLKQNITDAATQSQQIPNNLDKAVIASAGINNIFGEIVGMLKAAAGAAAGIEASVPKYFPSHSGDRPHATGGIFRRRHHAIIGESGEEAILPLTNRVRTAGILARAGITAGGHTIHFAPTFHVSGGDPERTAAAIMSRIEDELPRLLGRANDDMSFGAFA